MVLHDGPRNQGMNWFAKGGGERQEGPDKFAIATWITVSRPLHVRGCGKWGAGDMVRPAHILPRGEAAGREPLGLRVRQAGPGVSGATGAPAECMFLMFFSLALLIY